MKAFALKSIVSAAALAMTASVSLGAAAEQIDETLVEGAAAPTATVTFSRAELATTEGRATIERKIRNAAEEVCGSRDLRMAGGLAAAARNEVCYEDAVVQGMSQLNANQFASID
jgi:UrcA family protein